MQFERTRIAIRERAFPEMLDLALLVVRHHAPGFALALLAGVAPFAAFNHWLLVDAGGWFDDFELDESAGPGFCTFSLMWIAFEAPLATAMITLYLGELNFSQRPRARKILGDLARLAPQLVLYQVVLRAAAFATFFGAWFYYITWPYLNEVILLERNPWRSRGGRMGVMKRVVSMHSKATVSLFARWLGSAAVGLALILGVWEGLLFVRGMLTDIWAHDVAAYTIYWSASAWLVMGFFAVVRFLCYLDLRIRSEGWELEVALRAETEKLARQAAAGA